MEEKTCSFSEAMALLKASLAGLGLERGGIAIACNGGTREKSGFIAQKLVAGGFGRAVSPADRSVRFETRDGWFSWHTVAEGDDMINLFYSLGADDQPVDYLVGEAEKSPGPEQEGGGEGRRGTALRQSADSLQEKAAAGEPRQTGLAGSRMFGRGKKAGPDYHGETGKSTPGPRLGDEQTGRRESSPENRPVNRRDEAAPGRRGGGEHGLFPAVAGEGQDQAGKTGRPAGGGGNSRVQVRRRLF